jgi:hypothetical protein
MCFGVTCGPPCYMPLTQRRPPWTIVRRAHRARSRRRRDPLARGTGISLCVRPNVMPAAAGLVRMTLILSRASISRPSGHWVEDDYDIVADGERIVGRISTSARRAPQRHRGCGRSISCSGQEGRWRRYSMLCPICGYCRVGFKSMNRSAVQKPLADFTNVSTFPGRLPPNQNYCPKKGLNRRWCSPAGKGLSTSASETRVSGGSDGPWSIRRGPLVHRSVVGRAGIRRVPYQFAARG